VKLIFNPGDKKQISYTVQQTDVAAFHGHVVHPVCATFTLAREIEWATRQFVLDMRDDDEEGIGTYLTLEHKGPAFVEEVIIIEACVDKLDGNELICSYEAKVNDRLIAVGKTGQKILKREKLNRLFEKNDE
jgi:fluoroacetyl-CoA thioesterase